MTKRHIKSIQLLLLIGAIALLLPACTSTRMLDTWTAHDTTPQLDAGEVAVLSIHPRLDVRQAQQAYLVEQLQANGVNAVPGLRLVSPDFEPTEASLDSLTHLLKARGIEQVLTVSLLDVESEQRYVPGNSNLWPQTFYNPFYNYFFTVYQRVWQPGYYQEVSKMITETKLFDTQSGQLLWAGQSETPSSGSPRGFSKDLARAIVKALKQDALLL